MPKGEKLPHTPHDNSGSTIDQADKTTPIRPFVGPQATDIMKRFFQNNHSADDDELL